MYTITLRRNTSPFQLQWTLWPLIWIKNGYNKEGFDLTFFYIFSWGCIIWNYIQSLFMPQFILCNTVWHTSQMWYPIFGYRINLNFWRQSVQHRYGILESMKDLSKLEFGTSESSSAWKFICLVAEKPLERFSSYGHVTSQIRLVCQTEYRVSQSICKNLELQDQSIVCFFSDFYNFTGGVKTFADRDFSRFADHSSLYLA